MKIRIVQKIKYQILAPPEGESAIVELLDEMENDIGHIVLDAQNGLHLIIFGDEQTIQIPESQIREAFDFARRNLFNVDYGSCDGN
jgi:hypothetical protein